MHPVALMVVLTVAQVPSRADRVQQAQAIWERNQPAWAKDKLATYAAYDQAIALLKDGDDDVLKGRLIIRNAWVDSNQGRFEKSLRRMERAFPLLYKTKDNRGGPGIVICQFAFLGLKRPADSYKVILKHQSLLPYGLSPDQIADTASSGAVTALSVEDIPAANKLVNIAMAQVPKMTDKRAVGWVYIAKAESLALSNAAESFRYAKAGCRLLSSGDPSTAFGYMDGLALQFMQLIALERFDEAKVLLSDLNRLPQVKAFTVPAEIKTAGGLLEPRGRSAAGVPMLQAAALFKQKRYLETLKLAKFELAKPWSNEAATDEWQATGVAPRGLSRRRAWHLLTRATMLDLAAESCIALGRRSDADQFIRRTLNAHEALAKRGVAAPKVGELQKLASEPHARFAAYYLSKSEIPLAVEIMERGRNIGLARTLALNSIGDSAMQAVLQREFSAQKLTTIQGELKRRHGAVAVEFLLTRERGCWAVVMTAGGAKDVKLATSLPELERAAKAWRTAILSRDSRQELKKAQELFAVLFKPWHARFRPTELIICPDGPLASIPIAALARDNQVRLIDQHSVSVVPSLRSLSWVTPGESKPSYGFIVNPLVKGLPPLPRFEPVFDQEASIVGGRVAQGGSATKTTLYSLLSSHARVHVAAHGVFLKNKPLSSYIELADGRVTGLNLAARRLRSETACLWSCETGAGEDSGGEGVLGISWALRAAGVKSVIAPLWQVSEASACRMAASYLLLSRSRVNSSVALARAMKDERARGAPVHDWAAFQSYGVNR